MHKNAKSWMSVKGKTGVLRLSLTDILEFVEGKQGFKKKYESEIQTLSRE